MAFWRRGKKEQAPAESPLVAYDRLVEDLERQGAAVRKSAATLLALRGDLERDRDRNRRRMEDIQRRADVAASKGDAAAERVFRRDEHQSAKLLEAAEEALQQAEADAALLIEAAEELSERLAELNAERSGARARLAAGRVVTQVMKERYPRFEQ